MKIDNIVVATDLSPSSAPANRWAAALAARFGSRVCLLNIDETADVQWPAQSLQGARRLAQLIRDLTERRKSQLDETASWFEEQGIETSVVSVVGRASERTLEHLKSTAPDLLIMGKRGTRLTERFTLGSTTRRVLRRGQVPTLVVPRGDPTEAPGEVLQGRRIISATAFSTACLMALDATLDLAERLECHVNYVNVVRLPIPFALTAAQWPELIAGGTREELEHMRIRDLAEQIGPQRARRCTPSTTVGVSISEAIRDLALETSADLVALPSHSSDSEHPPRFGSTARRIVRRSRVPVLVYPVPYLQRRYGSTRQDDSLA